MAKQSKRSRKFQASGGVAARLKKGTITKRGKLKGRKDKPPVQQQSTKGDAAATTEATTTETRRDRSDDFVGTKNLATLDLDSFFDQVANQLDHKTDQKKDEDDDEPMEQDNDDDDKSESSSSKDDDDNDDDSSSSPDKAKEKVSKQTGKKQNESSSNESDSEDDDDDSDDDDDIEAAEARMRHEMSRLTEKDPEFAAFLQENEQDLLQFGQDEEDDEEDDEDMQQQEDAQEETSKSKPPTSGNNETLLTMALLDKLRRGTFDSHGIKALKKLVAAYRSGCHLADAGSESAQDASSSMGQRQYTIESPKVFDNLMVLCLSRCHEAFRWHLLGTGNEEDEQDEKDDSDKKNDTVDPDNQPIPPHKLENAEKWDALKPALQSFFKSTVHLLNESKEPGLLSFVLKSLAKYLPLATPFPRLAETILKTCIRLWSSTLLPQDKDGNATTAVRLQAFFRIRQLALTQPFPFSETVLKKTYLAYAQRAAFGTSSSLATTLPTLTFMGNGLVELYTLDFHSSYQHAFVYIRQLALQLRAVLIKKTPEAMKQVYGWQFMHCLKLWVAVLAHAAAQQDQDDQQDAQIMGSLLYPLAEIITGTARLAPSPVRLLPLRLQCIRLLQQLAASAQVYLPTTSLLLDCFDWKEWYHKPKKATKRNTLRGGLPLYMLLKLPKEDPLRTHEQLEAALVQLFVLLEREMELYRYTAAFPEFRVRIRQRCRDFSKQVRSTRWKAYAKACMEKSDQLASFCTTERTKLAQAPKDITQLECLRPSHVPTMRERHQTAVEKEAKAAQSSLAAAAAAASLSKTTERKEEQHDDDDDSDGEQDKGPHNDDDDDEMQDEDSDGEEQNERKKKVQVKASKKKRSKKKSKAKTSSLADSGHAMEQEEDEVVEGVDWLEE